MRNKKLPTCRFLTGSITTLVDKKVVFVGMSGGVDSSVAALLLKNEGYDVTGVFIKVWSPEWLPCTWREDRQSAMRAAAHIGIPLITFDCAEEYKRGVIDEMLEEYSLGHTPNPDVLCNRRVKFGAFFQFALERGADFVAMGHYARRCGGGMCIAKDAEKDQTYFLWSIKPEHLEKILFPIGEYEKSEVRRLAADAGLPNAARKDSQGLCFLGPVNVKDFLKRYLDVAPGAVLDVNGDRIGTHDGAILYTIGERHGFAVPARSSSQVPLYVVSKDIEHNTITVSDEMREAGLVASVRLSQTNWIFAEPQTGKDYSARLRYRQPLRNCRIDGERVLFDTPERFVALGQSLVLYDGERVIGGGIIESIE